MREALQADALNDLGALLEASIANAQGAFSENTLRHAATNELVRRFLPKATVDLVASLLMRLPNVVYARYNYTSLAFDVLIEPHTSVDARLRDERLVVSHW